MRIDRPFAPTVNGVAAVLDVLTTVVPTVRGPSPGVLHPASGATTGLLLLGAPGTGSSFFDSLYAELELYLQSAGIAVLRLPGDPHDSTGKRVRDLLGGVMLYRSMGIARVLVIGTDSGSLPSIAEVTAATMGECLAFLAAQSGTPPETLKVLSSLVAFIGKVSESVIGSALLLAPRHAIERSNKQHTAAKTAGARPRQWSDPPVVNAPEQRAFHPAAVLMLSLPNIEQPGLGASRETARLVGHLYLWAVALAFPERKPTQSQAAGAAERPRQLRRTEAEQRATRNMARSIWRQSLAWLDAQWMEIEQEHMRRNPQLAAARSTGQEACGLGLAQVCARQTWRSLDPDARLAWLRACEQVFSTSGFSAILDQTCQLYDSAGA